MGNISVISAKRALKETFQSATSAEEYPRIFVHTNTVKRTIP